MKETRTLKVINKIFSIEDIKRIARFLSQESSKIQENNLNPELSFQIDCADNSKYESASDEIFSTDGPLETKKAIAIHMSLSIYRSPKKRIDFSIRHNSDYKNELIISGEDASWVQSTFVKTQEIINSIKPQNNFASRNSSLIFVLLAYSIGTAMALIFNKLAPTPQDPSSELTTITQFLNMNLLLKGFTDGIVRIFLGSIIANPLHDWFLKIFPVIEFDFGPEHFKTEKIKRSRIRTIIYVIIFPIIIELISKSLNK